MQTITEVVINKKTNNTIHTQVVIERMVEGRHASLTITRNGKTKVDSTTWVTLTINEMLALAAELTLQAKLMKAEA